MFCFPTTQELIRFYHSYTFRLLAATWFCQSTKESSHFTSCVVKRPLINAFTRCSLCREREHLYIYAIKTFFKTVWPYDENPGKSRWPNGILRENSHRNILTRSMLVFWLLTWQICFISFFLEILWPRQCSGSVGNHSESNRRYKPLGRVILTLK